MPERTGGVGPRRKKKRREDELRDQVDQVAERAVLLPRQFVNEAPRTAASLLFSALPKDSLRHLGAGLEPAWNWLQASNTASGQPGLLAAARARALGLPDPDHRRRALDFLNKLQRLPDDQQTFVVAGLGGGMARSTTVPDAEMAALVGSLFPEANIDVGPTEGFWGVLHDVNRGIGQALDAFVGKPTRFVGGAVEKIPVVGEPIRAAAGAAVRGVGTAFLRGVDVATGLPLTALRGAAGEPVGPARYLWPEEPGTGVGVFVADTMGIGPSDPRYQDVVFAGSLITQLVIGKRVARTSAAVRTARREALPIPPDVARARFGVIGSVAYDLARHKKAEQWVGTHSGRKAMGRLWTMKAKIPDEGAEATLARAFPMLEEAPGLLRTVARASSRDEMTRAFVEWVDDGPGLAARLRSAERRLKKVEKEIEGVGASAVEARTERVVLPQHVLNQATPQRVAAAMKLRRQAVERLGAGPNSSILDDIRAWERGGITQTEAAQRLQDAGLDLFEASGMARVKLEPVTRTSASGDALAQLVGEQAELRNLIGRFPGEVGPLWRWPRSSPFTRIGRGAPANRFERFLSGVYKPGRKLTDDLPGQVQILNPWSPDAPADAMARNAQTVRHYLTRAGLSEAVVKRHTTAILRSDNPRELFDATKGMLDEIGRQKRVSPELAERVGRFSDDPLEGRHRGVFHDDVDVDGRPRPFMRDVLEQEVGDGDVVPLPSMPSELLSSHINLPSVDRLIEATSFSRRLIRGAKAKGGLARAAVLPYDVGKFIANTSTAVFKPLVLAVRIPAMTMRIQLEQIFRVMLGAQAKPLVFPRGFRLFPGGIPVPGLGRRVFEQLLGENGIVLKRPDKRFKDAPDPVPTEIGLILEEAYAPVGQEMFIPRSTLEYRKGYRVPPREVWAGVHNRLAMWRADPLMPQLARLGPEGFVKWLDRDDRGGNVMETLMDPLLEKAGVDRLGWAKRKWRELQELTGGDERMIEAVATGRWHYRGKLPDDVADARRGAEVGDYGRLTAELGEVRTAIREAKDRADGPAVNVLIQRKREIAAQMRRAEGEAKTAGVFNLDDEGEFIAGLEAAWGNRDYTLPPTVMVKANVHFQRGDSVPEAARKFRQIVTSAIYRPFRLATWADVKGTRGSLYYQQFYRNYRALTEKGWGKEAALAHATARAARQTVDLMYDLQARTSAQRYLRNAFWFAPAWQEVVTTWMVKIPSQYYWPVGAGYIASRATLFLDAFKRIGLIQKDSRGDDFVVAPGMTDFLAKVVGRVPGLGYLKVLDKGPKDIARFRPSGFNLVTSGLPGLSLPYAQVVGNMAKTHGGAWAALADIFMPFGAEVTWTPSAIRHGWTAVTGNPPPWEGAESSYEKQLHDLGMDDALKQAFVILKEQGETPPKVDGFPDTEKGKLAFHKATLDYTRDLMGEARRLVKAWASVRLVGASVYPVALRVTDEYKESWNKFWSEVIVPKGFDEGLSEEQNALIERWIGDHDGAVSYRVFKTVVGEPSKELAYTPPDEDAFWAQLYTGERRVLTPEEFTEKLLAYESYRHYSGQLRQALGEIGNTAPELLRNGHRRALALNEFHEGWGRYMAWHPEYGAMLDKQRLAWAKEGAPLRSFEAERLATTLRTLQDLEPHFSDAGIRQGDYRKVLGQLKRLYAEEGQFGAPNTTVEKGMDWYFTNVMDPYMKETAPIWERIRSRVSKGLDNGHLYDKLRKINDKWGTKPLVGPGGYSQPKRAVRLFVQDLALLPAANKAVGLWNNAAGVEVLRIVTDARGAIPIRVHERPEKFADAEFSEGEIVGNPAALKDPVTLAHEIGHALGLPHAGEGTTAERFIGWKDGGSVPAVGLMGTEKGQRGRGPTLGEAEAVRRALGVKAKAGMVFPAPEEVFYGSLTPEEQEIRVIQWQARTPSWLTEFQLKQAGFKVGPKGKEFLGKLSDFERGFQEMLEEEDVSGGSRERERLDTWRLTQLRALAERHGPAAKKLLGLHLATPVERLKHFGFGKDNEMWGHTLAAAKYIVQRLEGQGLSPRGFSEDATSLKVWFYSIVERLRDKRPKYDALFDQLSFAFPSDGEGYRDGALLYEALFFSNWSALYIPDEVTRVAA